MFNLGRIYDCEIPSYAQQVTADDVICRISAPSDAIVLVLEAWFTIVGTDDLNEVNAVEFCRLSSDGSGGGTILFEPREVGSPAFGGSGASQDSDDWTAAPTVSDVLGGARPLNLATGFEWSWATSGKPFVVSPSGRFGFRIVDTLSASMTVHAGLTIAEIGG